MKYFTLERVAQAAEHLGSYNSSWVIVPLVLASNGVNPRTQTNVDEANRPGTTRFLDRFFSGSLIGLDPFPNGRSVLRPKFKELKASALGPSDLAIHQKANLWGSTYSSRGYREMRNRGELSGEGSSFLVNQSFVAKWTSELPSSFHFEELLVWLYAFNGLPENVDSWIELFDDYQQRVLGGIYFDECFKDRFHVNNNVPWPSEFTHQRPSNAEFTSKLMPGLATQPVPEYQALDNGLISSFHADASAAGLRVSKELAARFVASMLAKPFLILTGLSGSGKTKIAQAFAHWITPKSEDGRKHYEVVAVGADWIGSDSVLGYPNGLDAGSYVSKPALDLIIHAGDNPSIPHFLILDEMNLSHVERYFADMLSVIESGEHLHLHTDDHREAHGTKVPSSVSLPKNLFIIGTVNVDETTYMFSPKVLDRANVLEFRMSKDELERFLESAGKPDLAELAGLGHAAGYGDSFVAHANDSATLPQEVKQLFDKELLLFFQALQSHGAEFGYRTAYEAGRFMHYYKLVGDQTDDSTVWFKAAFDCVVVQKLLPKLHGSRAKLSPVLKKLWFLCVTNAEVRGADTLKAAEDAARSTDQRSEPSSPTPAEAPYLLSAEKIGRMWRLLMDNGFASFAEA